jgi:drug/metabolite transporter (DMT)-like permease
MHEKFVMIAYLLFFIPLIFIVNFFFDIITFEKIQGLPVFFPLIFCSIGLFFASKAYGIQKSALTLSVIIANLVLFLFPFIYMIGGTLLFGP